MVSDRSNGIYRGIVVAIVGLILIGAAPNKDGINQPNQSASQKAETDQLKAIVTAIKESNRPPKPDNGCKAGKDDRSSDLCAQWKAADAASDAAWWTFFAAITTVIGVIVGGFTLVAAGFAALYAKDAATAASVGASAAIDAVAATNKANLLAMKANARATRQAVAGAEDTAKALDIARLSAESGQRAATVSRAWICPGDHGFANFNNGHINGNYIANGFMLTPTAVNFGQSPAIKVEARRVFLVMEIAAQPLPFPELQDIVPPIQTTLAPNQPLELRVPLNDEQSARFREREVYVIIYAEITYFDVFCGTENDNKRRITRFTWKVTHAGGFESDGDKKVESLEWAMQGQGAIQT